MLTSRHKTDTIYYVVFYYVITLILYKDFLKGEVMESYEDLWQAVLDYIKGLISETAFNLWIKAIQFEDFSDSTVYLALPRQMHYNIVTGQYDELIREAFEHTIGFPVEIEYRLNTGNEKTDEKSSPVLDRHLEDYRNEQFTFDNFIVGNSNKFAYAAAKAVARDPGARQNNSNSFNNYNPLFIYGNSGLGKTHLLNAISHEIKEHYPEMNILYIRAEEFTNELIQAIQNKTTDEFHNKYRKNIDVLLVDDIQFISGKEATEEEFFHTFDALVYQGNQIVLTSDRPPKDIRSITDRLRSRFEDGLIADIQTPDFETRREIIKRKALLLNFDIPENVINYIAENIKSNIRQLEGVTKKLYALCDINDHTPTVALAKSVIKIVMEDTEPLPVTIQKITEEVSRTTGVSVEDIYSKIRKSNVSHARKITFYVIRKVTNMTYEDIGAEFNKDHTSVMYNINTIESEIERNSKLERQVNDIINNIKSTQ